MYDQEQHEMVLETTHPSGAEEWACHTCGRRFLMQWPPEYKKIVLEGGDQNALHSGGKGGIRIGLIQATQTEGALTNEFHAGGDEVSGDHPAKMDDSPLPDELRPWLKWMRDAGF